MAPKRPKSKTDVKSHENNENYESNSDKNQHDDNRNTVKLNEQEDLRISTDAEPSDSGPDKPDSAHQQDEEAMPSKSTQEPRQNVTWRESSLQHVLAEYGMPEPEKRPRGKQNKPATKASPPKKKPARPPPTPVEDEDDDRKKARQERNLRVLREVQMLRDAYYDMYMKKLRDKVETQREDIKKKSDALERKLKAREEKEKREGQRLKKRMDRHTLEHNDDFIHRIPKSDIYKILALQTKLRSEGMLRTQEEHDQFWEDVRQPQILRKYMAIYQPLPKPKPSPSTSNHHSPGARASIAEPRSRTTSQHTATDAGSPQPGRLSAGPHLPGPPPEGPRPLTNITETRESRPSTREVLGDSGPVGRTGGLPGSGRSASPRRRREEPWIIAKMAAAELDRKYPQMELPPMTCFKVEVAEKTEDPAEMLAELEAERRSKERRLFVKRLRRMYHLTQSNTATAHRILSGQVSGDDGRALYSPGIGDVIAVSELIHTAPAPSPPTPTLAVTRPWTRHLPPHMVTVTTPETGERSRTRSSGRSAGSRRAASREAEIQDSGEKPSSPPQPLSLNAVTDNGKILEAKCLSTLWTNYLSVGKSKFAPVQA